MIFSDDANPNTRVRERAEIIETDPDSRVYSNSKENTDRSSGPRSRIMDSILVMLYAKPMRSSDIAKHIKRNTKYVSSYLSYWRVRGLVEYVNGFWYLTPKGEELARSIMDRYRSDSRVDEILRLAHHIISENISPTKNNKNEKEYSAREKDLLSFFVDERDSKKPQEWDEKTLAKCVNNLLSRKPLTDDERHTLSMMVKHYIVWGSTYIYIDQLAEEIELDINSTMRIVRSLQSKHLLYLYQDPKLGFRVGLSKTLKTLINICRSESR